MAYGVFVKGWDLGREDILLCVTYLYSTVELIFVYNAQVTTEVLLLCHTKQGVTTDTE